MLHNIRIRAKEKGWTVAEVERRAGLTTNSIYKWDENEPGVYKVANVAKVLGTTVDKLIKEPKETQ